MTSALLPINASNLEKEVTDAVSRIGDLQVDVDKLWNPQTCPENLLPWLAWALSVDNWNSDWPVDIKRAQIADSIEIHRRKGTVLAVKLAMEAFGVQVDLQEWFEDSENKGAPHTFNVKAWAADCTLEGKPPVLTNDYYLALQKAINNAKPVRSHYDFKAGVKYASGIHINPIMQAFGVVRVTGEF